MAGDSQDGKGGDHDLLAARAQNVPGKFHCRHQNAAKKLPLCFDGQRNCRALSLTMQTTSSKHETYLSDCRRTGIATVPCSALGKGRFLPHTQKPMPASNTRLGKSSFAIAPKVRGDWRQRGVQLVRPACRRLRAVSGIAALNVGRLDVGYNIHRVLNEQVTPRRESISSHPCVTLRQRQAPPCRSGGRLLPPTLI
jgi:hypothetical protein